MVWMQHDGGGILSNEIHCNAEIYCKEEYLNDVKDALKKLGAYVTDGSVFTTKEYIEFEARYMDTEDAQQLIDELGDKVDDFLFYFESYDFGDKWRYTKEFGVEKEEGMYRSDVADDLREAGYNPAEIKKILDAIFSKEG